MRISGTTQHVAGWAGGLIERAEPDRASRDSFEGRLRAGENLVHGGTGRLAVRGGARAALTLAEQSISDLVALHRWSPTGAILVAHSATNDKHYAYALTAEGGLALPSGAATETGSRVDLGWNTINPIWAQGVELFETLFLVDTADTNRQAMKSLKLTAGALALATVSADLDANAVSVAMKPAGLGVYGAVLFAYGWEDEGVGAAPHILRHSLLGQDPTDSVGWNADAYATIGAQGEPIRSVAPGQDILLVAKYAELYRVFGDPDALPGWQFQIQPVNASQRVGAVNQHALCYESDRWWGIGRDGPWVFDGKVATSLVGARRERWGQVGDLATAFVEPHPRRGSVLFGFAEPAALVSGTRASRLWSFDTVADKWAPDFTFPSRFWITRSIAQAGVTLDTIPDLLVWVTEGGTYEHTALSFRFSPGDVSAQTEVWVQPAGGSSALAATLPAGMAGGRISGLARGVCYTVKVRHRKGDALTEFGSEVEMCTRIDAPRLLGSLASYFQWGLLLPVAGRTVAWVTTNGTGGDGSKTLAAQAAGPLTLDYTATDNAAGSAYSKSPFLNTVIQLTEGVNSSPEITFRNATWAPAAQDSASYIGVAVSQQMDADSYADTAITVLVSTRMGTSPPSGYVELQYRVFGDPNWIAALPSATITPSTRAISVAISGLAASRRYEVRARMTISGTAYTSTAIVMFTRIGTPTASIATAGAGTPVTNLTVQPPGALPGFDTEILNASGVFETLYANVATTPTVYQSTIGVCGQEDRYFVRTRNTAWPEGYQSSAPVELAITNPCVISP
jgi:hypothetical protein